ncbi:zinc ribbon domain-containing protein [Rhizobium leguminosarum]|jgi:cytochrome c biogenesis protein CcdA|nr:zinc ribbon domain-containing protein [Rhizobium leguminosarum]
MAGFLRIAGGFIVASSLLFLCVSLLAGGAGLFFLLETVFSSVLAGVMVSAFGAILAELEQIRSSSARQISVLEDLVARSPIATAAQYAVSPSQTSMTTCPDCKSLQRPDATTCSHCGLRLSR